MWYSLTWRSVEDPREVIVAAQDSLAGYAVFVQLRLLPAAEVPPDALTDEMDVLGHVAAVDIPAGEPITPDLLEPIR